ncbi:MAG: glycosyltransferase [bacterium]
MAEPRRQTWVTRAEEILSENLRYVRPDSGLDVSLLGSDLQLDPNLEILVQGDDVALVTPDDTSFKGFPRSIEEAQRRRNFLDRQIVRLQQAQLIFATGLHWGLLPSALGGHIQSLSAVVIILERSLEQVQLAFRLYDLRAVLSSRDVFWCVGPDLIESLADLMRRESLYLIGRNLIAPLSAPGLTAEETQDYQQVVATAFGAITPDYAEVSQSLGKPVVFPKDGPQRIWTYSVPDSFHEPIVNAIASGFRANGLRMDVASVVPRRTAPLRFIAHLSQKRPDLLVLLNMPGGDFVRALGLPKDNPFLCSLRRATWFSDNAEFYSQISQESFDERDCVFWMDRTFETLLASPSARKGGFLPVAASATRQGNDIERFQHPVSFVGNVMVLTDVMEAIPNKDRRLLLGQVDRLIGGEVNSPMQCAREITLLVSAVPLIERVVRQWRQNPLQNVTAVAYFLYVVANSEKRARFLRPLIPLGLHLYGTDAWGALFPEIQPDRVHGRIGIEDVTDLYRSSLVNIGLHSCQCPTCLNARDFDVLFSGGCLVADWVPDSEAGLIEPGVHATFVCDPQAMFDTVAEFLADNSRRREMAERGREHVSQHHTYAVRTRELLRRMSS